MVKVKEPIQLVYFDEYCKSHWEYWDNYKKHMMEEHGVPEGAFVDAEEQK